MRNKEKLSIPIKILLNPILTITFLLYSKVHITTQEIHLDRVRPLPSFSLAFSTSNSLFKRLIIESIEEERAVGK